MESNNENQQKHTIELTNEEAFVLYLALEQFCDIKDGEFGNAVKIAEGVWNKIPDTGLKWKDVSGSR